MTHRNNTGVWRTLTMLLLFVVAGAGIAQAQGQRQWLTRGSLWNWFSEYGCEIEEGNSAVQQDGLQWPAQYRGEDSQAAKGFWIGVKNYKDQTGITHPYTVVHVGPRVNGSGEFFPISFSLLSRFDAPKVFVDGALTFSQPENASTPATTLQADRVLETVANTAIGLTMTRKVYQFSQQYHDNYHIFEFTFKNTGWYTTDTTTRFATVDTLRNVMFYWQFRYAVSRQAGNCVNNSARWGINEMNDAIGFGYTTAGASPPYPALPATLRAQYAWCGLHSAANKPGAGVAPGANGYTNLGIPLWNPSQRETSSLLLLSDTTWRLAGAQFVGNAAIHADLSPTDTTDDLTQPFTTNTVGSDDPITRNNLVVNDAQNATEYAKMTEGHIKPSHAWVIEGTGQFDAPTHDPANGTPGGYSIGNGYGPYTIAPGQSIKIVYVEAANGLSYEEGYRIGKNYRDGLLGVTGAANDKAKNDSVFLGRDRLFTTFQRAIAAYNNKFVIPQPPQPPAGVNILGGGNKIAVNWDKSPDEGTSLFTGYRVYRAWSLYDSTYHMIFECGPGTANTSVVNSFDDVTAVRGQDYYYYVTSFGPASANTGAAMTPAGSLESSRFYTQTFTATNLKRPAPPNDSIALSFRIVPNPYSKSLPGSLRYPDNSTPDRISFFNVPGNCRIRIYTELGELIQELEHNDGTGDLKWNSITKYGQVVVSGIYVVLVENRATGQKFTRKLVVIR